MSKARKEAIARIQKDLREVVKFFGKPKAMLKKSYAPRKWSMRQILVHLSDTQSVYLERLRRLAADDRAVLQGFDQDLWAERLRYDVRDLKLAKQQFQVASAGIVELLRHLDNDVDSNTGTHSEAGPKTFAQIYQTIAGHTAHHMEQVRAIAAGKPWTPKAK